MQQDCSTFSGQEKLKSFESFPEYVKGTRVTQIPQDDVYEAFIKNLTLSLFGKEPEKRVNKLDTFELVPTRKVVPCNAELH